MKPRPGTGRNRKGLGTMGNYRKLVIALEEYLEYHTYVRLVALLRAQKAALTDLELQQGNWADGYAQLGRFREAMRSSGKEPEWPDDL